MQEYQCLLEHARKAREKAYAPYSGFAVGAAVQSTAGAIYVGANVENASYGLTVCAERNALIAAFLAGERNYLALAVMADSSTPVFPCGACLQVIRELAGNIKIISSNLEGPGKVFMLKDLYPYPFPPYG